MRVHVRIVCSQWHSNTIGTGIGLEKFHIVDSLFIGHTLRRRANPLLPVLVLDLIDNRVLPISDLVLAGDLGHLGEVRRPGFRIARIIIAKRTIITRSQPQREATRTGFGIDIRSRANNNVQPKLLRQLKQGSKVMRAGGKVQRLVVGRMVGPARVKGKRRETHRLDLLEDIAPQTRNGDAPVVEFTREDEDALTVDLEAVVVPLDDLVQTIIVQGPFGSCLVLRGNCSTEQGEDRAQSVE